MIGSPPPVRGKERRRQRWRASLRITPACAGKRRLCGHPALSVGDHPRLCGEKLSSFDRSNSVLGSPPPVRGKVAVAPGGTAGPRITPACAGKSFHQLALLVFLADHPRLCGEKLNILRGTNCAGGSPPPVRGKVLRHALERDRDGITPACAGKRSTLSPAHDMDTDHPRLCGEKDYSGISVRLARGSPPPVRGKVPAVAVQGDWSGITPACAGKR